MSRVKKNWIFIIVSTITLSIIYNQYKLDIYQYTCEHEVNAPSCYVLHLELNKEGRSVDARKYLELSCQLKYQRACDEL